MQNRTREIALRRADRTTLRGSCGGRPHNEHASADRSKKAAAEFLRRGFSQTGTPPIAAEILRRLCPKRERPVYFVTRSSHLTMASMANIEMAQTMTKMLHVAEIEMRL